MGDTIDLHLHTQYSDGALSPLQAAEAAAQAGLRAIAITDHDTMEGLAELRDVPGLEIVPGIERKALFRDTEIHILGYDGDWEQMRRQPRLIADREARNAAIIEKLRADGVDITTKELYASKKGVAGRPHIAALLVKKGYFPDVKTAFAEWLGEGRPYYASLAWQTVPEIIQALGAAGAASVLAHPLQYAFSEPQLRELVQLCRDAGAVGMECLYSGYSRAETEMLLALCREYDLCPTGGSDFHGPNRPERVIGGVQAPYAWLCTLREREARHG